MRTSTRSSSGRRSALEPGANGVFGLFSNLMQASRWVHGPPGFLGFDVANPSRAGRTECFRAIEESAAYVSRGHRRHRRGGGAAPRVDEAVLTGGAAKGTLWPQIVADMLGIPVRIPAMKESTALGAAIYAGVGARLYDDAGATARSLVRFERTCEPDGAASTAYRSSTSSGSSCTAARSSFPRPASCALCGAPPAPNRTRGRGRCLKRTQRDDKNFYEDIPAPDQGFFLKGARPTTGE